MKIRESVENLTACDRPIGWTQHVTLGPPFLEKGRTEFRASATRSKVFEQPFGVADYLAAGALFDWPLAPRADGGVADLRRFTDARRVERLHRASDGHVATSRPSSSRSRRRCVWRSATSGSERISRGSASGRRTTAARTARGTAPTLACGMEFGVSPMPETRREMIDRGRLFDVPTYRWIPAKNPRRGRVLGDRARRRRRARHARQPGSLNQLIFLTHMFRTKTLVVASISMPNIPD